jgi:hypothetical protein
MSSSGLATPVCDTPGAGRHRGSPQPESWTGGGAASLAELGLGEQESTHRWTGTTCRAAPLACSDWSEERDVGRSRSYRVEGGGDNGKPGWTGRHPRCAVTGVLICAVGALVITHRDLIWHWFTLSLYKGLSRDQRTNLRSSYNGRLHDYI